MVCGFSVAGHRTKQNRPELAVEQQRFREIIIRAAGIVHDVLQLVSSLQQSLRFDLSRRCCCLSSTRVGLSGVDIPHLNKSSSSRFISFLMCFSAL